MDKIMLKNMKFYAYHGVLPEEQERGQYFYIDVLMSVDLRNAGKTDCLEDTVNYAAVYETVKTTAQNNIFQLIEKLADSISREILSRYDKVCDVTVRIRKPDAPIGGELDWAEVEITRCKNEL